MGALLAVAAAGFWVGSWPGAATAAAAAYLLECCLFPIGTCLRCMGRRTYRSPFSRGRRDCGKCGGSGKRIRLGVRVSAAMGRASRHSRG